MGRVLKVIAWAVGACVAIFVLAAIALYLFFDPNDFREDIAAAVKDRTGRDLVIDGDVSLTLFPWLAVEVGNTTLGDVEGFGDEPMAAFDNASFSVRLLPLLLQREVVVGAVDLEALRLNLKVDEQGRSNWSDFATEEEGGAESGDDGGGSDVDITRVSIANSTITYSNAESDERIVLDSLDLTVGRLKSDGSPVPLEGALSFNMQPANLGGNVTFNAVVAYDSRASQVSISDMDVDGSVAGIASIPSRLSIDADSIQVDTEASEVRMSRVEMTLLEMDIVADFEPFKYGDRITPKARVAIDAFSPRTMMQLFDVEPPVTADPGALSSVIIDGTAQLMTDAVEMTDVTIKLDDTTFKGTMSVPRANEPYRFDLVGDSIDATRYMEPVGDAGAAAAGESVPVEIPADLIAPLNARGKAVLQLATLGGMVFENIEVGLNSNAGRLRLYPISSQLFGGSYNGDVRIDVTGSVPVLSINENVKNVDLSDLAKAMYDQDNVTGTISGSFKLTGRGADMLAVQKSLAGNMSFELLNGTFEGTDIWYELRRARALLKKEEPPEPTLPAKTEFSSVTATGVVKDGVMRNNDLYAEIPHMQLTGSGSVDLPTATVDYGLTARVLEKPEFVKDATAEEIEEFTEAVIPLKITGPLASPSVRPDIEKLLRNRVEEEIKDRLKDKLGDLFNR